jgi:hypothetical protein
MRHNKRPATCLSSIKEFGVRKMYKNKKRSCPLCKPHKRGYTNRWKEKEKAELKRFARAVAQKKFDEV